MSYRGRPSKGCGPCRARKVKCDEAKPICSRCSKAGHDCKYRDPADLLFRNQTAFAAQKAEESWRKRSKSHQRAISESSTSNRSPLTDNSSPLSNDTQNSTVDSHHSRHSSPNGQGNEQITFASDVIAPVSNLGNLSITPELKPDMRRLAYERFLYDFVSPESPNRAPDEPSDALWTFIPILYQNAPEGSCIATVVNAVAYINFANRCNAPQAEALAEECLGKGIVSLAKLIGDKKMAASNEALCSVYLMGVYENLTIQQRKGTFLAHQHGANALLQLRSVEQYYSDPVSARLYEVAYAQMLLGNLQAGKRPPLPIRNLVSVKAYLPSLYSSSNIFVIQLIWREAMLHAKWHEIKQSAEPPTSRLDLQELLQSALDLDGEFQAWETTIPSAWRYQMEPNSPEIRATYDSKWQKLILGSRGAPEEIHSYTSLKRCWIWGFYRTSRIFLLRDLLEILNWMFRLPEPDPFIIRTEMMHDSIEGPRVEDKPIPTGLDNIDLRVHHSFATVHMVNIIEKSCSAILGNFTVPIYTKSNDDVVGMRGYVCLWTLGTMDAVLGSGLVPDSEAPKSPPNTGHCSPQLSPFPQGENMPSQIPLAFSTAPRNDSAAFTTSTSVQSFTEFPDFPPIPGARQRQQLSSLPSDQTSNPTASSAGFPPISTAQKNHIFDSSPAHPFDHPVNLPTLDFNITKPKSIDVAARREWLNRLLYYVGTELGIKKALYVPLTEGFMQTVKPSVDSLLGR